MKFEELYRLVEEQNIRDLSTNNITKGSDNAPAMAGNIFSAAYIELQMRDAGYTDNDINRYWELRKDGTTHEDALKQIPPPKGKEIDYQDPEVQRKIKQAFIEKGYNSKEDMDTISNLLKPEKINSLKASMLANRMDINQILNSK